MTHTKGKVTVPQTIDVTVWPQLRRHRHKPAQVQVLQHSRWQALQLQCPSLSSGGSEPSPESTKEKELDLLVVDEGPAALRVEVFQAEDFQEEEPQEEEPQDQEESQQNKVQLLRNLPY